MVKRKSNIELLRIVSMLLIISFHYVFKSGYVYNTLDLNTFIVKFFYHFGELGVNLFILISGYFLIKGKFSYKKLVLLLIEVLFYQVFIYTICYFAGLYHFTSFRDLIFVIFPTIFNQYWFITAYVLLYILSPFLNKFANSLDKNAYKKFLIIILVLWSFLPTVFGIFHNTSEDLLYYNRFIWFIVLYFTAGYIHLYVLEIFNQRKNTLLIAGICTALIALSIFTIYYFRKKFELLGLTEIAYFWPPNSILVFILSISIFYLFLNMNMKSSRIINTFASTTLGVYILHDNVFNKYLWNDIFETKKHLNSNYSILYILGTTVIIYLCFSIIDLIRQLIERHTIKKILDSKVFEMIVNKIKLVFSKVLDAI